MDSQLTNSVSDLGNLYLSGYLSVQKLSLLFLLVCFCSWICSSWTLLVVYITSVFLGLKISNIIVTQDYYCLNGLLHNIINISSLWGLDYFFNDLDLYYYILQKKDKLDNISNSHSYNSSRSISKESLAQQVNLVNDLQWIQRNKNLKKAENIPKSVVLELNSIQLLIFRDFVNSWFSPISSDSLFPKDIKQLLQQTFINLAERCYQKHTEILVIAFLQLYQHHFASFKKAKLIYERDNMKVFQNDNIKKCLTVDEAFCKKVDFHYAVQSTSNEIKYMRGIVNLLLSSLAEPHLLHGISVKILLIEILTSKIFIPAINLISDPDWLLEAIILATSQKKIILNDDWNATEEPLKLNTKINEMVTNDKFSHHIYKLKEADLIGKADYHGNNLEYLDHLKSSESHLSAQNHSPVNTFLNNIDSEYLDQKYTSPKSHVELTTDLQKDNMNAQMFMDTPSNLTEINSSKLPLTALKENSDQQEDVIDGQQNTLSGVDPNSHYLPLHQVPSLLVEGEKSYLTTSDGIAVETSNSFPKHTLLKKRITDLKSIEPQQNIKNNKCLTLFTESSTLKKELESDLYTPEVLVDDVLVESTNLISPAYIETDLISSTGLASFLSLSSSTSQVFTSLIEYTDLKPLPRDMSLNWNDTTVSKDEIEQINPSISEDMRIFQDIAIPEAFPFRDEKSSSTYSLYTIEYEALYFTEEGKSVMRTGIVKRRYREFTNLQSRLEGQQAYKKYLKNLKVPKRWPTIPFKTLDKETVETRRIFLEKYLKDLITNEAICNGPDLREFLAYEGSSHIAFVKKSPDVLVPRIDKFLMRSVSGVMDRIKMIPNIPQEMISGLKGRDISDEKLACNKIQIDPDYIEFVSDFATEQFHEADPINILMAMCNQLVNDLKEVHLTGICEDQKTDQKAEIFKVEIEDIIFDLQTHITTQDQDSDKPKCSVVLELLALGLQDHWLCRDKVLKSLQLILAKILNGALQNTVTKFTTEDQIVSYLKHLREIVWPQGHFNFGNSSLTPDMQKAFVRVEAKKCLSNFLPKLLKSVIGIKQSEDMVDLFLNSIEKQQLNKHFLYTCMDVFIEELFPEITATDFLNMLFLQLEF